MSSPSAAVPLPNGRRNLTLLGHPVGLYVLFFTEMWERFSYYGMRALLMLYMVEFFRWSQADSSTVYKWYTSLVYLTPLIGGYLADRVLGNKWAVIIGASLMAVGHFLMAFTPTYIFFSALVFLIAGNGFFKPNMSTQVGRLYPQNDPRRDGAYTIFYMGINLGAFLSPLLCGWLAHHTPWGYHAGFTAAGVGMVLGLLTYLFGLPLVRELPQEVAEKAKEEPAGTMRPPRADEEAVPRAVAEMGNGDAAPPPPGPRPLTEQEAEHTPSLMPWLTKPLPALLGACGVLLALAGPLLRLLGLIAWDTVIGMEIAAGSALFTTWIVAQVHWALRDRLLAILIMGVASVTFWAAGEQAGNALNVWAENTTNRYLTQPAPPPPVHPQEEQGSSVLNPVPAEWFQSINPLAIFVLAPPFAALWTWLGRRRWDPPIAAKMALGVLLMGASFGILTWSAKYENGPTTVHYGGPLPEGAYLNDHDQLCRKVDGQLQPDHAGRLDYDPKTNELHMRGVLSDLERDDLVGATAPAEYVQSLAKLKAASHQSDTASVKLAVVPPGFDLRYAGVKDNKITYDAQDHTLTTHNYALENKDIKGLEVAGGNPAFRDAMNALYVESARYRVSSWWLFWFYLLGTVGELCLSPLGLSMVSKLSPARFATMLMGLWLLTSFFGNFIAGALGELAETTPPISYFSAIALVLAVVAVVLFLLVRTIVRLMHGVQ
ncbi:MAG TPA: peptide MFS transporter [Gemmataceae bacterium]|nr:peptide MFS transporter [Gemmataceae bacterium]